MKIHRILCLCSAVAAVTIPQLGAAELPFPNGLLGKIEGTFDSCAKSNPKNAKSYENDKKKLLKGTPENEIVAARASKEYKDAYEQAKRDLAKMTKEDATATCTVPLEDSK
jgi:hypothetical protein